MEEWNTGQASFHRQRKMVGYCAWWEKTSIWFQEMGWKRQEEGGPKNLEKCLKMGQMGGWVEWINTKPESWSQSPPRLATESYVLEMTPGLIALREEIAFIYINKIICDKVSTCFLFAFSQWRKVILYAIATLKENHYFYLFVFSPAYLLTNFVSFFFFFNFYWSIVTLPCSVSFYCTAKWISNMYTYISSFLDFLPI